MALLALSVLWPEYWRYSVCKPRGDPLVCCGSVNSSKYVQCSPAGDVRLDSAIRRRGGICIRKSRMVSNASSVDAKED